MSDVRNTSHAAATSHAERLVTPPFVVVTSATFFLFVFVGIGSPVLPRFIERSLGGGGAAIGLAIAAFAVAAIALRPVIGRLGDTAGRRALMVGGALLSASSAALTGFAPSLFVLLPLRALAGVGEAALFVGAATLIADLAPPARRAEAASLFSVAVFAGLGVGPLIGEAVLGDGRYALTFLVGAGFCLAAAVVASFAPDRVVAADAPPAGTEGASAGRGFHRAAFAPGIVLACGVGAITAFLAFVPTYVDRFDLGGVSGVFLLYSVLCLVIRIVFAKLPQRIGLLRSVAGSLLSLALGGIVAVGVPSKAGLYAATVLVSFGIAFLYPALLATAVDLVDPAERSRVLATFTMFFEVGTIMTGLLLGPVVSLTNERGAFAGGIVFAIIGLFVLRRNLVPKVAAHGALIAAT
jgi:MFS family permease